MNLRITGRHVEVSDDVKEYIEKTMRKLKRHMDKIIDVEFILSQEKFRVIAEVNIQVAGKQIHARDQHPDIKTAIDMLFDKVDRRLEKYKGKMYGNKKHLKEAPKVSESIISQSEMEGLEDEHQLPQITDIQRVDIKPMSLSEAMMEMELLDADFYIFSNPKDFHINILYRRKDGNYGLIEPA